LFKCYDHFSIPDRNPIALEAVLFSVTFMAVSIDSLVSSN